MSLLALRGLLAHASGISVLAHPSHVCSIYYKKQTQTWVDLHLVYVLPNMIIGRSVSDWWRQMSGIWLQVGTKGLRLFTYRRDVFDSLKSTWTMTMSWLVQTQMECSACARKRQERDLEDHMDSLAHASASPRLASPRFAIASPRLASPRLASPRLALPCLALPRLARPHQQVW